MELWGWAILVAAALVIGLVVQYAAELRIGYEALIVAVGAGAAGYLMSEFSLYGIGKWGVEYFGVAIFPALIGALVVAVIVELLLRFVAEPALRA